ncbi:hypothetical protein ABIB82_006332 [Bradyrhizobium sp. i1.8.4]
MSRAELHAVFDIAAWLVSLIAARSRSASPRDRSPGQRGADSVDLAVTIEQIVGVERDDRAALGDEVDAASLDVADAEIEAIEKLLLLPGVLCAILLSTMGGSGNDPVTPIVMLVALCGVGLIIWTLTRK